MWLLCALAITLPPAGRYVAVAPAESLRVTIEGAGAPVVFLPGLFGSAFGFRRVVPLFADAGWRTIVVEPLGVGGSSRPERADYSLTAQAARVAATLDSLGVRHAVLVAHSVGGSIALRLAVARPDLVAGIVSLEGGPAEAAATPGFRRAMSFAPWIKLFGGMRLIRGQIRRYLAAASGDPGWVTDDVVAGYAAGAAADVGAALKAYIGMAGAREPQALRPRLAEIRCPVRLLVGAVPHPSAVPQRELELLAASLPHFAIDSLPGVGHFPQEERPAAVLEAVTRLTAEVLARAGGGS